MNLNELLEISEDDGYPVGMLVECTYSREGAWTKPGDILEILSPPYRYKIRCAGDRRSLNSHYIQDIENLSRGDTPVSGQLSLNLAWMKPARGDT